MATPFPPNLFNAEWYLQQNPDVAEAVPTTRLFQHPRRSLHGR